MKAIVPPKPLLPKNYVVKSNEKNPTFSQGFLTAQLATALAATLKYSGDLKCVMWDEPNEQEEKDKYEVNACAILELNIKGFESAGIYKAILQINVAYLNCELDKRGNGFTWDGNTHRTWIGADKLNVPYTNRDFMVFCDADGYELELDGDDGLYFNEFAGFDDQVVATDAIEAAFASLGLLDVSVFLNNVLFGHNKAWIRKEAARNLNPPALSATVKS